MIFLIYTYLIHVKKYFMSVNNHQTINETVDLFNLESSKLQDLVPQSLKNFEELSLEKIIEVYYQVINVTALAKFLRYRFEDKKNLEKSKSSLTRIQEIEKFIDEQFNGNLHPLITSKLKKLIENSVKNLKDIAINQGGKNEEVESQAMMYEKLRQIMSTKEFVDQYNNGLSNTSMN